MTDEEIYALAEKHDAVIVCTGEGDYNDNVEGIVKFGRALLAAAASIAAQEPNYKEFSLAVLKHSREYLGSDVDGAMVQDAASEHGLLDDTLVQEPCGEGCACADYGAFPTSCYRYSSAVLKEIEGK